MYVQHAGCEAFPADPRAPHSNDFLLPFFNRTMFCIGYHAEHHDHPGVHWSELPALHVELRRRVAGQARSDR
jgi:fatty acid desaturase